MVVPKDCHIQNVSAQEIASLQPCRQSLLEAVGMCVENASLDQMSFAINKILLTGFDEKVFHRIMGIIFLQDMCCKTKTLRIQRQPI